MNKLLPPLDDSTTMAKSDLGLTTWSKLKKRSCEMKLRRHPSGNNNTTNSESSSNSTQYGGSIINSTNALKSQSMPNLYKQKSNQQYYNNSTNHNCGDFKYNNAMNSSSVRKKKNTTINP